MTIDRDSNSPPESAVAVSRSPPGHVSDGPDGEAIDIIVQDESGNEAGLLIQWADAEWLWADTGSYSDLST